MPINIALTEQASMVRVLARASAMMDGVYAHETTSARIIAEGASAGNAKRTHTALRGSIAPTEAAVQTHATTDSWFAPRITSVKIIALAEPAGIAERTNIAGQAGTATIARSAETNAQMVGVLARLPRSVRAGGAVGASVLQHAGGVEEPNSPM